MTSKRNRQGFSLIESAIVLAVVGLVIGGIWVAAAHITQKRRAQQTVDGLLIISEKLLKTYHGFNTAFDEQLSGTNIKNILGTLPDGFEVSSGDSLSSPIFRSLDVSVGSGTVKGLYRSLLSLELYGAYSASGCQSVGLTLLTQFTSGRLGPVNEIFVSGSESSFQIGGQKSTGFYWNRNNIDGQGNPNLTDMLPENDCEYISIIIER